MVTSADKADTCLTRVDNILLAESIFLLSVKKMRLFFIRGKKILSGIVEDF